MHCVYVDLAFTMRHERGQVPDLIAADPGEKDPGIGVSLGLIGYPHSLSALYKPLNVGQ